MLDGYFSYKPAFNLYFTPVTGPYCVTRHGSAPTQPPAISPRRAMSQPALDQQASLQPPSVGTWSDRTPSSVTTGGLLDVYDTDQ